MEQPYVYAYPPGTAPPPPQGSGIAGVIVDPRFCAPYPVDLAIVRKMMKLTDGNFVITDVNGNLLFKVKEPMFANVRGFQVAGQNYASTTLVPGRDRQAGEVA